MGARHDTRERPAMRGIASVEIALILPIMITMMLMTMDLARYLWTDHVVSAAAAEGARLAILNEPSDSDVKSWIATQLKNGGVTQAPTVTMTPRTPSTPVTVGVSVPFNYLIVPQLIAGVADLQTVSASAVMEHEP